MFKEFANEYFKHLWRCYLEGKNSILAKILGIFEIRAENSGKLYGIIMENLFYDIEITPSLIVYDLKGSESNRLIKKGKVYFDTNFKIDRNSEPLPIDKESYRIIDKALQNDCKFLSN